MSSHALSPFVSSVAPDTPMKRRRGRPPKMVEAHENQSIFATATTNTLPAADTSAAMLKMGSPRYFKVKPMMKVKSTVSPQAVSPTPASRIRQPPTTHRHSDPSVSPVRYRREGGRVERASGVLGGGHASAPLLSSPMTSSAGPFLSPRETMSSAMHTSPLHLGLFDPADTNPNHGDRSRRPGRAVLKGQPQPPPPPLLRTSMDPVVAVGRTLRLPVLEPETKPAERVSFGLELSIGADGKASVVCPPHHRSAPPDPPVRVGKRRLESEEPVLNLSAPPAARSATPPCQPLGAGTSPCKTPIFPGGRLHVWPESPFTTLSLKKLVFFTGVSHSPLMLNPFGSLLGDFSMPLFGMELQPGTPPSTAFHPLMDFYAMAPPPTAYDSLSGVDLMREELPRRNGPVRGSSMRDLHQELPPRRRLQKSVSMTHLGCINPTQLAVMAPEAPSRTWQDLVYEAEGDARSALCRAILK